MATFCDECPLRGDCAGPIEGIYSNTISIQRRAWRDKPETLFYVTECYDDEGSASQVFSDVDDETLEVRVEVCPGPQEKAVARTHRKPAIIKVCGALGVTPLLRPDIVERFHLTRDIESGLAAIEAELWVVETRPLNKFLIGGAALFVSSGILETVGIENNSFPQFEAGSAGMFVGGVTILTTTILKLRKPKRR